MKPISAEKLAEAIAKFESRSEARDMRPPIKEARPQKPRTRLLICSGDNYRYIGVADVAYFTREGKYIEAVTMDGRHHITDFGNLSEVLEAVDPANFFQLTRNTVAALGAIEKVSKWFGGKLKVQLRHGESAEVSASRRQAFLDWLGGR